MDERWDEEKNWGGLGGVEEEEEERKEKKEEGQEKRERLMQSDVLITVRGNWEAERGPGERAVLHHCLILSLSVNTATVPPEY